jgi:hypothetical protein
MVTRLDDILVSREPRQILKIDIEGSEWEFFANAGPVELAVFHQIVGEFHDFNRFFDPAWQRIACRALQRINETHQLIHLHGNNSTGYFLVDDVRVPALMELTFVLRSAYRFEATDETFPGPLDSPNTSRLEDIPLAPLIELSRAAGQARSAARR